MLDSDLSSYLFGCGFAKINTHHKIPKSQTKDHKGRYPVKVDSEMHFYWHCMTQNMSPINIAEIYNKLIYKDSCYKIICEHRRNNKNSESYKQNFVYGKDISDINSEKFVYCFYKMFKDKNPFEVCRITNIYFLDPKWRFVCKHKKKYYKMKPFYSTNRLNYKGKRH